MPNKARTVRLELCAFFSSAAYNAGRCAALY